MSEVQRLQEKETRHESQRLQSNESNAKTNMRYDKTRVLTEVEKEADIEGEGTAFGVVVVDLKWRIRELRFKGGRLLQSHSVLLNSYLHPRDLHRSTTQSLAPTSQSLYLDSHNIQL